MMRFWRLILGRLVFFAAALAVLLAASQRSPAAQPATSRTRARASDALRSKVQEKKYLDHALAVEAIMRELAVAVGDDRDEWGVAGLLHDIDIGTTAADLSRHGLVGAQILRNLGFSEAVVHAVSAHDDRPGVAHSAIAGTTHGRRVCRKPTGVRSRVASHGARHQEPPLSLVSAFASLPSPVQ